MFLKYQRTPLALATLALLGLAMAHPAYAGADQLTGAAQLSPGGTTISYPAGVYSLFAPPLLLRAGGNTLTLTKPTGNFIRVDQGDGFYGGLPDGTPLLASGPFGGDYPGVSGPIDITFATPVSEFGLLAENLDYVDEMTYSVFNGDTLLATFTGTPTGSVNANFLGARATEGDAFTRVSVSGYNQDFVIAPVTFSNVIPEPGTGTLVVIAAGLLPLVGIVARRRRAASPGAGQGA